ncbi:MAG: 1-acyl-sn-glycerol-3-phosphate acyltransferase [Desulfatibacillaceae bacterium]
MLNADSPDNRDLVMIDWASPVVGPLLKRYFKAEVRGVENIPRGAALYVGNHNMGLLSLDSFIFGYEAYRAHGPGALPYGLGHDFAVTVPPWRNVVLKSGGIRANHENAHEVFSRRQKCIVYPGGDVDALRPWRDRNKIRFGGRTGYMELALREEVPIVPIVTAGAHSAYMILDDLQWLAHGLRMDRVLRTNVWPVTLCLPWGIFPGPPPVFIPWPTRILIQVLPPVRFDRSGPAAAADHAYVEQCSDKVEQAMQEVLTQLAVERDRLNGAEGKKRKKRALGIPDRLAQRARHAVASVRERGAARRFRE